MHRRKLKSPAALVTGLCAQLPAALVTGLCALVLLCVAAGTGASAAGAAPARTAPLGGINVVGLTDGAAPASAAADIALAKKLHAKVVRTELSWALLEPHAAGQTDARALAFVDTLVADAAAAHIKVIAVVRSTPCWQSTAPAALIAKCTPGHLTAANAWPPRDPSEYGRIVSFIVHRYGIQLAAIEVWNEPDQSNELYFAGPEKPARYAAVLRAAYVAAKEANPQVLVLAGSLVGSNGVFLRALYRAGIKGFYDGLAIHFYNLTLASIRSIREVQLANGDSKPLWLDEFGWASCWPHERTEQEQACVTPQVQASNITNTYRALANTPYIAAEVIFELRDLPREVFGAVTRSGRAKPAYKALSTVFASPFSGRVSPVTLRLRRHGAHVLATGSGPVGDFMGLEAFKGGALRYRAVFILNRFNRYSIVLPGVLGTKGLRVRVYQYWSGLGHAAQKQI